MAEQFVRGLALEWDDDRARVRVALRRGAQEALFSAASAAGLRVASGLVVSDRNLIAELHVSPESAFESSRDLIERWHGRGLIRYAVSPRFSVSCSDELLSACGELAREAPEVLVTSHLNEIEERGRARVDRFSPGRATTWRRTSDTAWWAIDRSSPTTSTLATPSCAGWPKPERPWPIARRAMRSSGAGCSRCAAISTSGSAVALGTDVGAGTGLSMLKEGLMAYQVQMLAGSDGVRLGPGHLLWLATAAGAAALGLSGEVGDLGVGKSADFVLVRAPEGSTLDAVLERTESVEETLGALFTLAREESIAEVRVAGRVV